MAFETDLMEWPTTRPLTRWSWMVRLYWWLIFLFPPLALWLAWDTARTARSADEALGLTMFVAPFLLAAVALGLALAYRAWISTAITRFERKVLLLLGVSALQFVVLVAFICEDFGDWHRGANHPTRPLTLILTALWLALALMTRRRLHHGIPALWPHIWWIVLLPLPFISFFVAVGNLFPSKPTDDPSAYPFWFSLTGAVVALPLLAYRALFSPAATRIERVLIALACLTVLAFFLFLVGVWRLLDSAPTGASPDAWTLFYALSGAWAALAVATRHKLGGLRRRGGVKS
jgi:hypothetical protein